MAISSQNGNSNYSDPELEEAGIMAEINITPLTDIFLVLLIIFMVTSSVLSQMGVQVQLPKASQASSVTQAPGVIVTISKGGAISINGTGVPEDRLGEALKIMIDKSSEKTVVLEGDRQAVLGMVVKIMDEAKKAGAVKFAIATQPSDK